MDKGLITGSTSVLILKLLEQRDMYGYQMIETLAERSDKTFELKAGTLYPILHGLERDDCVQSYDDNAGGGRIRKYYHITPKGKKLLEEQKAEWEKYSSAVNKVLRGGECYAM